MTTTSIGTGTYAHSLRACDVQDNSQRGNNKFAAGSDDPFYYDEWRGDVARIYMYLHYMNECLPTSAVAAQVDATALAITASDRFEIVFEEEELGTNENIFGNGFVLFPNPAHGEINIATRGIGEQQVELSITAILGQTVYNKTQTVSLNGMLSIDTIGLAKGVYILKFNVANCGQFITKFFKKFNH